MIEIKSESIWNNKLNGDKSKLVENFDLSGLFDELSEKNSGIWKGACKQFDFNYELGGKIEEIEAGIMMKKQSNGKLDMEED